MIVTGGAGFIGSHLVERLASRDTSVVALDNGRSGSWANLASCSGRVKMVSGDIRDLGRLTRLFRGTEVVFHLAALSRVIECESHQDECFSVNALGTYNVLRAARNAGVRRVVLASSREVYGEPTEMPVSESAPVAPKNCYGTSKAVAELYCRPFIGRGLEVSILRLANVYGARDRDRVIPTFSARAAQGLPLVIYGGEQVIDFVSVDDVIDAFLHAGLGEYVEGPLNVGSGIGTTIDELARRIFALWNVESKLEVAPSRDVEVTRFVADITLGAKLLGLPRDVDPLRHLGKVKDWWCSCARPMEKHGNGFSVAVS